MADSFRRCGGTATPDVSIVIPCYNGHAFLARAVESALRQDLESKVVIVVDDGSTAPETAEAIARLPEEVTIIRQENCGVAAARNRGFEAACGRYVLPLDCDDWIEPDCARRALELISGREDAFVYTWIATFGEYEAVLLKRWDPFELMFANQIGSCILVPKALWCRVGGYDETMRIGSEDWDFNIRLMLAESEGLCLPEPLFHYRVSATGKMRSVDYPRHGATWRGIQKKYPYLYSARSILRRMRARQKEGRRHPTWFLLAVYGAHRLLPHTLFSLLFRAADSSRRRARSRISRKRGGLSNDR